MFIPGSWAPCTDCPAGEPAAPATPEVCEDEDEDTPTITIAGEVHEIRDIQTHGDSARIECDGQSFIVFASREDAGQGARDYWADMAANDAAEFRCMVGDDTLVAWAMGQYAGPGSTQVRSLTEWLDLHLDCPEEHYAGYDGEECDVDAAHEDVIDECEFTPAVAYRTN